MRSSQSAIDIFQQELAEEKKKKKMKKQKENILTVYQEIQELQKN